jgi:hypothetical protein
MDSIVKRGPEEKNFRTQSAKTCKLSSSDRTQSRLLLIYPSLPTPSQVGIPPRQPISTSRHDHQRLAKTRKKRLTLTPFVGIVRTNPASPLRNPIPHLIPTNAAAVPDAACRMNGAAERDRRAALRVEGVPVAAFGAAADHAVEI